MTDTPDIPVTDQAADWHTRLSRRAVSNQDLRAFDAWRQDPANAAAYAAVEGVWAKTRRLAHDPEIQGATAKVLAKPEPLPKPTVTWFALTNPLTRLGIVLAAISAAGGLYLLRDGAPATYATQTGEQRLITLADGSRLRLNTDSAVRVRFTPQRRDLELTRGEAFFEVAHNPQRPFIVQAGAAAVRALGTRFDVRRDDGAVHVTLVEGRLDVRRDHALDGAILAPNQQLTVTDREISAPRPTDAVTATSWTTGRLVFRGQTLGEAVAEVNRYARRKVVLDSSAALAQEPVSGVFDTGDTTAFVAAVDTLFDLKAHTDATGVIHLGPRAPTPEG